MHRAWNLSRFLQALLLASRGLRPHENLLNAFSGWELLSLSCFLSPTFCWLRSVINGNLLNTFSGWELLSFSLSQQAILVAVSSYRRGKAVSSPKSKKPKPKPKPKSKKPPLTYGNSSCYL